MIPGSPGQLNQVRKKAAQRLGVLGPLLNRRSSLSIRNGVLLYKQLLRPMMEYAGTVWWSTAHSHIRKLQVLQSKCLQIATRAPWYIGNMQIHDDIGVYSLLTTSDPWEFWIKVSWCWKPLSYTAWLIFTLTECWPGVPKVGRLRLTTCLLSPKVGHVTTLNRDHLALFNYPDWGFPTLFPAAVSQLSGYYKDGARPALFPCEAAKFYCNSNSRKPSSQRYAPI